MRRLMMAVALSCAVAMAAAAAPPAGAATAEPGLVGAWRLVRFEDTAADGKVSYPFGEHPLGYFVYDPTGHLSVQVMRNPPIAPFAQAPPSEAEVRGAYGAYLAYFGTWRVDKAAHVLHHVIEGALNPRYLVNPDQTRPYRLAGDTLVIEINDPKTGRRQYRELQRVR
ncbi:lipocalin-like domain-containing protein [Phenylobacterium sp.]|uniref:lipocalin-like domain-containing protein n=1 Tax=Phenylobacterium sp. TaxID=1871053 RepID=UPI002F41F2CB